MSKSLDAATSSVGDSERSVAINNESTVNAGQASQLMKIFLILMMSKLIRYEGGDNAIRKFRA